VIARLLMVKEEALSGFATINCPFSDCNNESSDGIDVDDLDPIYIRLIRSLVSLSGSSRVRAHRVVKGICSCGR
jgi:hypothetical protein